MNALFCCASSIYSLIRSMFRVFPNELYDIIRCQLFLLFISIFTLQSGLNSSWILFVLFRNYVNVNGWGLMMYWISTTDNGYEWWKIWTLKIFQLVSSNYIKRLPSFDFFGGVLNFWDWISAKWLKIFKKVKKNRSTKIY